MWAVGCVLFLPIVSGNNFKVGIEEFRELHTFKARAEVAECVHAILMSYAPCGPMPIK
jgi:hypothetical protein